MPPHFQDVDPITPRWKNIASTPDDLQNTIQTIFSGDIDVRGYYHPQSLHLISVTFSIFTEVLRIRESN